MRSDLCIVGVVGGTAGLAIGGLVTGLGHGITYPVVLAIATMRAPVGDRGTVTATFTAVFDLVLFSIAPVLGVVIRAFGYPAMFLIVSASLLVGIALFYRFDRGTGRLSDGHSRISDRPSPAFVNAADPLKRSQMQPGPARSHRRCVR